MVLGGVNVLGAIVGGGVGLLTRTGTGVFLGAGAGIVGARDLAGKVATGIAGTAESPEKLRELARKSTTELPSCKEAHQKIAASLAEARAYMDLPGASLRDFVP